MQPLDSKDLTNPHPIQTKAHGFTSNKKPIQCSVPRKDTLLRRFLKKYNSLAEQKKRHAKDTSKRDMRIQHITAKRFNISPGQPFPIEAIEKMASLGVEQASITLNNLRRLEQFNKDTGLIK